MAITGLPERSTTLSQRVRLSPLHEVPEQFGVPSLQLQHQSSSVLLAGMENGCGGRSLSLSFRMESTTDGSRIPRLAEFARIKTNSFGLITPKAGRSIRLSQSKVVCSTRPASNRRPPHCERGKFKTKT